MTRVTISLEPSERAALMQLAKVEKRDARAQAAWIVRRELERLGLLRSTSRRAKTKQEAAADGIQIQRD